MEIISNKHIFTSKQLFNYLRDCLRSRKFRKLEYEILSTLAYKTIFEKVNNVKVRIAFPYRADKETEFTEITILNDKEIGDFLKKYSDESSIFDSFLVDVSANPYMVTPLQIKILGLGYEKITENEFINFLKKYLNYSGKNVTFIIALEGKIRIRNLNAISDWLRENKFPFEKVILINLDNKAGEATAYQLMPCDGNIQTTTLDRATMLGDVEGEEDVTNMDERFWK